MFDYSDINRDIVQALRRDQAFQFKHRGKYLQEGRCPECGRRSVWISVDKPILVRCNHRNSCGYEEPVRVIYPELFENLSQRYPATPEDPNATARAYMDHVRHFPAIKVGDWFEQAARPLPGGGYAPVVRFHLWDGCYWDRVINKADEHALGDKAFFKKGFRYAGKAWQPPGQRIEKGDTVFIVEGIFHAIALSLCGYKVLAAFSSNNLPTEVIERCKDREITWRLGYDDDPAGRSMMAKYYDQLQHQGERVEVALTGSGKDWDDLYRLDKLNDDFIEECLYRGRLFTARTIGEKAYHWYCKHRRSYTVLEFGNRLYSVHVGEELSKDLCEAIEDLNQADIEDSEKEKLAVKTIDEALATERGRELFARNLTTNSISNCLPKFLYCEIDKESKEVSYFFDIALPKGREVQVAFSGAHLESPKSFNKALLNQAPGSTFDGTENQLKMLRDRWFDGGVKQVETIGFLGYDKQCQVYVYQDFAYHNGRKLKRNRQGYFTAGKHRIKTSFKSFHLHHNDEFNPDWIGDYYQVFSRLGMVALAFWLGSLFAEQIRAELKVFPFLELTGEHGAGKSTVIEFLWKLCGRDDYEGFDPSKATFAARTRAFSQLSNLPVVLIESDRQTDKAKKGAFDFEELKTAYNGRAIRSTGAFNRGNDTVEPPFRGTIVIAQNDTVDGSPALLSRIVHCHATKAHFSEKTKRLAQRFERATVEEVSGFLPAALRREKAIIAKILEVYPELDTEYAHRGEIHDQRVVKTHAMVSAMVAALPLLFPAISPEQVKDLQHYVYTRAVNRQGRLSADHPEVQKFWDIYDYLNVRLVDDPEAPAIYGPGGKVEAQTLNHSKDPALIAINLIHYKQQCEQAKVDHPDINALKKLLPNSRRHKFLRQGNVKSAIEEGRTRHCWIFENSDAKRGDL
ncbi:toprim domain-containing protein [Microbulbifer thermotolerans]|uniref:toprim domain-containing protein n=1 Tax=Microbulbifer thermotolerans TaxID=252514 RepID=UPI00224B1A2B|nr:toprim domain-containing protein [Microbulbifer thermotolerans]MCX2834484.1 toprim domain-containing protein [Microbulbifer thermotolerans]